MMRDQYFIVLVMAALVIGCQSQTDVAEKSDSKVNEGSATAEEVKSDESQNANELSVPAEKAEVAKGPDQVCRDLLNFLREDNTQEAQKLFTRKATTLMLRYNMPLGFPGKPDATFQVQPAKFATTKQELCQVMCTITESNDGSKVQAELGWMLKRSNDVWRVSGMLLPVEADQPMDFLNFESSADIGRVKSMLTGGPKVSDLQVSSQAE